MTRQTRVTPQFGASDTDDALATGYLDEYTYGVAPRQLQLCRAAEHQRAVANS